MTLLSALPRALLLLQVSLLPPLLRIRYHQYFYSPRTIIENMSRAGYLYLGDTAAAMNSPEHEVACIAGLMENEDTSEARPTTADNRSFLSANMFAPGDTNGSMMSAAREYSKLLLSSTERPSISKLLLDGRGNFSFHEVGYKWRWPTRFDGKQLSADFGAYLKDMYKRQLALDLQHHSEQSPLLDSEPSDTTLIPEERNVPENVVGVGWGKEEVIVRFYRSPLDFGEYFVDTEEKLCWRCRQCRKGTAGSKSQKTFTNRE
jgi:hypothetical protein